MFSFGQNKPEQQTQQLQPKISLEQISRNSALGRFLIQFDLAYNATSDVCKFRTFFYNLIPVSSSAVGGKSLRDKQLYCMQLLASQKTGFSSSSSPSSNIDEAQWIIAERNNPDPTLFYSRVAHFNRSLRDRIKENQVESLEKMINETKTVSKKQHKLVSLNQENEKAMLEILEAQRSIEQEMLVAFAAKAGASCIKGENALRERILSLRRHIHHLEESIPEIERSVDTRARKMLVAKRNFGSHAGSSINYNSDNDGLNEEKRHDVGKESSRQGLIPVEWASYLKNVNEGIERMDQTVSEMSDELKKIQEELEIRYS